MSDMKQGTVKWFDNKKGYGFISPSEGSKDLFVHMNEIKMDGYKTLQDGQSVQYEEGTSDKGPVAVNVNPQ
jgi:CspA family cold shock protein